MKSTKIVTLEELERFIATHDVKDIKIFVDNDEGEQCIYEGTKDSLGEPSRESLLRLLSQRKRKVQ